MKKIITFISQLLGSSKCPEQRVNSASANEASLRFLAELQQCCAALPKGRAEVVFADHEFHLCMQWQEGEKGLLQPDSPKALAFWINGENTDVDYQELEWQAADETDEGASQNSENEDDILKGKEGGAVYSGTAAVKAVVSVSAMQPCPPFFISLPLRHE